MILYPRPRILKTAVFCLFFLGFAANITGQTPPPTGDPSPFFCSQASWANGGLAFPGDVLGDIVDINGQNLQWYASDPTPPNPKNPLPATTIMADGKTYYVTQTVGGVESAPLAVTVMDRTCGCIKEPDFETQDLMAAPEVPVTTGYNFFMEGYITAHKTCGSVITPSTPPLALGTLNNFNDDRVAPVSAGPNPDPDGDLPPNFPRTTPSNPNSMFGLRMNNQDNGEVVSMSKEFIAGEVFVFNFSLFLENPASHRYDEQPYFQVRIYDQNDQLVQTRCIVSNANDCVFNVVGSGEGLNVYSDWSCLKLNTLPIQGQKARVEFTVADCTRSGHAGYVFIDDLYVGDDANSPCNNISFGYLAINSLEPSQGSGACYITEVTGPQGVCSAGLNESLPFPIDVCGEYRAPISTGPDATFLDSDLVLNILQNDVVVGTLNNGVIDRGAQTFCFTIDETDISVSPAYGNFSFQVNVDFGLNCGDPYEVIIDDRNVFQACPSAGCAQTLIACDDTGTGIGTFDLTSVAATIRNGFTPTDVGLTYYETEADAYAQTAEITSPQTYSNTNSPDSQTIYVRLDWNMTPQGCTYLVKMDLLVKETPQFDFEEDTIVGCGANISIPLVATPDNLADMNNVNYAWYMDGVRLPHFGSVYTATQPGTYEVTVSNDIFCEVTRSIVVEQANYSVSLGNDVVECGISDYTLTATVTDNGSTPAIDQSLATYSWSTGDTTESITVTESGTYTVDVTYEGCVESATVNVEIATLPDVSLGADFETCVGEDVVLSVSVSNIDGANLEYVWYDTDGNVIANASERSVTVGIPENPVTSDFTYSVEVYETGAPAGCFGTDEITVSLYANENCIIPQGISPNTTLGQNDNLDLTFLNDRTGISSIEIFNRHGRSVYTKTGGYTKEWHGQTDDGDELSTGTYYYVVKLEAVDEVLNKQVVTGWVYINREIQ